MTAMTAPLSLYLTRFSAPPAPPPRTFVEIEPSAREPAVILTQAELDARLAAAAQGARSAADLHYADELASLAARHEAAIGEAVAVARADWVETEGNRLGTLIDKQIENLRNLIADRLASVLRPLLAVAAHTRTIEALTETIDRLLADPSRPAICVRGSDDLLAVLRAARPAPGIDWVAAYQTEVTITTCATHVETRLAAALSDIAATES